MEETAAHDHLEGEGEDTQTRRLYYIFTGLFWTCTTPLLSWCCPTHNLTLSFYFWKELHGRIERSKCSSYSRSEEWNENLEHFRVSLFYRLKSNFFLVFFYFLLLLHLLLEPLNEPICCLYIIPRFDLSVILLLLLLLPRTPIKSCRTNVMPLLLACPDVIKRFKAEQQSKATEDASELNCLLECH